MGKEKRPLQSERINRYLFCFWFQVIRQDDLSNRDFPQFLFHPVGEADCLCRTAGFPSVIDSNHSVGVLYHIAVSVGVDAWEIFFLNDNNIRTSLQQFTGSCFLIQAVQTFAVREHCDQLQRRIGLLSFQHQLCKILIHAICKATHKTGESICNGSIDLMFQSGFYFVDLILRQIPVSGNTASLSFHRSSLHLIGKILHFSYSNRFYLASQR